MNINFDTNIPQEIVRTVATANKSIERLNAIINQANEEYKLYQRSISMKSALDALLADLNSTGSELRELEYLRYCNLTHYEHLGEFAFIAKARTKKECKTLTREIHALRRLRASKNEKYLDTEAQLNELLQQVNGFDFPALAEQYRTEVLTKLNPCIIAISQGTGQTFECVNPILDVATQPQNLEKFKLVDTSSKTSNAEEME